MSLSGVLPCIRCAGALVYLACSLTLGCLDRPVAATSPHVTARFTSDDRNATIDKIDLLFMIDNSQSMADKQSFLSLAVPDLLAKLIDPVCVDEQGHEIAGAVPDPVTHSCPAPTRRDFEPVNDIHVGVISSSLGAHGASGVCADVSPTNDRAHLLARGATGTVATFRNTGFLAWNPDVPDAFRDEAALQNAFSSVVAGVGQDGCGYESQLEAVYRFLNDPAPYDSLTVKDDFAQKQGVDQVLLQERADFLRPDSLVAVISITDENDYSIEDEGQGFWVLAPPIKTSVAARPVSKLPRGTAICQTNPNNPCCYNCGQKPVPAGCPAPDADPECLKGPLIADEEDPSNLRATRSKTQYGRDFAYPVERYVEGFSQVTLQKFGKGAKNPLYDDATCTSDGPCAGRDPSLVFFAAIAGVPWQDIAVDRSNPSRGFQDAKTLTASGTWDVILGRPTESPPVSPRDPHMIVSVDPRPGLAGPNSARDADPIHGHEWDTSADSPPRNDLQYACTFDLVMPRECAGKGEDCDCVHGAATRNPLCQNPATGAYGTVQFKAKAYPGLRELQVIQGLGDQGILGSICPANTKDPAAADFGYRPVMNTLLDRLRVPLRGRCLPRALEIASDGSVPCIVMEAFTPREGTACRCDDPAVPGRSDPSPETLTAEVKGAGPCVCEIQALAGNALAACQRGDAAFGDESGWCYIDPLQSGDAQQCELVSRCPATGRRILRYFGSQPRGRALTLCQEQAFSPELSSARRDVCAVP